MGGITMSGASFRATLSELLGIKAGLGVDDDDLNGLFNSDDNLARYAQMPSDAWIRLHSSEFQEVVEDLLFKVGRLQKRRNFLPGIATFHKYRHSRAWPVAESVMKLYSAWLRPAMEAAVNSPDKMLDPGPLLVAAAKAHGRLGLDIAAEMVQDHATFMFASPWSIVESRDWKDMLELKALFSSENLNSQYGNFFDQRYIDFLNRNFESIDSMHWRKFEELTAEYLDRNGYRVELGPGRNDDGVDVRAWPKVATADLPPALIVQCKRQKATVDKVIVKSLYADILSEQAGKGMIVTTSRLSVGAQRTAEVRNYPIDVADRDTLKTWFKALHSPGSGIIM